VIDDFVGGKLAAADRGRLLERGEIVDLGHNY
jgi:hypothetical protein